MHVRFISIFDLFLLIYLDSNAEAAQKQSYHLNSTDNTASLPLSLECDGKTSKINNTPCMRSYCTHELMVLLFSEPMITARSGAVTVRVSEYIQLLKGDCIGDNVYMFVLLNPCSSNK